MQQTMKMQYLESLQAFVTTEIRIWDPSQPPIVYPIVAASIKYYGSLNWNETLRKSPFHTPDETKVAKMLTCKRLPFINLKNFKFLVLYIQFLFLFKWGTLNICLKFLINFLDTCNFLLLKSNNSSSIFNLVMCS